ncbi:MAG: GNAT family N-acetyltransferase [Pseudomonadota bacterium]
MHLRDATPADRPTLERWDAAPHIVAISGDPDFNDWDWAGELGRDVPWRQMLVAEVAGRAIGFVQIIDPAEEESHYWGDCPSDLRAIDIWIGEPEMIGQGHGGAMMRAALTRCFADPAVTAVLVDPMAHNTDAHRFYEAMGFSFVERRSFGPDDCFVFRLDRARWAALADAPKGLRDA